MFRVRFTFLMIGSVLVVPTGCTPDAHVPAVSPAVLRISAAASTREAVEAAAKDFMTTAKVQIEPNFGSSSTLAKQIEESGQGDLFLSADVTWVESLKKAGLVAETVDLLTNRLVVVVPADSALTPKSLDDLTGPGVRRCAVGAEHVPAGTYAREAFTKSNLLEKMEPKLLSAPDVRAALTYVVRGEAEAGIVYRTDALEEKRVRVAFEISPPLHRPIVYPLALIRHQTPNPEARAFYDFLKSERGLAPFLARGFGASSTAGAGR